MSTTCLTQITDVLEKHSEIILTHNSAVLEKHSGIMGQHCKYLEKLFEVVTAVNKRLELLEQKPIDSSEQNS